MTKHKDDERLLGKDIITENRLESIQLGKPDQGKKIAQDYKGNIVAVCLASVRS